MNVCIAIWAKFSKVHAVHVQVKYTGLDHKAILQQTKKLFNMLTARIMTEVCVESHKFF